MGEPPQRDIDAMGYMGQGGVFHKKVAAQTSLECAEPKSEHGVASLRARRGSASGRSP